MASEARQPYFWERQLDVVSNWRSKPLRNLSKGTHILVFLLNLLLTGVLVWSFFPHEYMNPHDLSQKRVAYTYMKLFSMGLFLIPVWGLTVQEHADSEKYSAERRALLLFLGFGSLLSIDALINLHFTTLHTWPLVMGSLSTTAYFTLWRNNYTYLFGDKSVPPEVQEHSS